jgi:hypothetical protein
VGARLTFSFWAQNGALTLLEHRQVEGVAPAQPVDAESFARHLRPLFTEYVRGHTGEVVVSLRREAAGWVADYDATGGSPRPPEAKTQPVNRRGVAPGLQAEALEVASRMARLLTVPSGGAAALRLELGLEDDRLTGWEHRGYRVLASGGGSRALSEESVGQLARVLLSFSHGVGRRTVTLELRGEHREGEPTARGLVTEARTLHPTQRLEVDPDFAAEYRAMHEDILRRWREGVREGAELLARYSAEEAAIWLVGGMLTRGAGLLFEAVAPTVTRALMRGGTEAAGWLRTMLGRLPQAERKAFDRFWTKVRMEGAESLSQAERNELLALMNRIERLVRNPLSTNEKNELRRAARRYFERFHPKLHDAMTRVGPYEVHHCRPLEYAHLFAAEDINAAANLKAVVPRVHQHISSVWTEFRSIRGSPKSDEVDVMAGIIDRHFGRWYNQPQVPGDATSALASAVESAKQELRRTFNVR